jgi:competence protein ComEA
MNWKEFTKDYLTFTRKERIGLLVILIVVIGIWIFPKVTASRKSEPVAADTSWITAAKKLQHKDETTGNSKESEENIDNLVYDKPASDYPNKPKGELFYFDPNTLSFAGWKRLGMPDKTITTIQKYLSKGGHFYKAEDLQKIYGIHPNEYERLKLYIRIETINVKKDFSESFSKNESKKEESSNKNQKYRLVEINTADTSAFIALPGIGNKLAARIINFRDKLGGFYSIEQISEIYGLPDSTFQKIKPFLNVDNSSVKKININIATKDEMKLHPYIKWNLANAIVEYRNQHGNYTSADDLKKISMVTEEIFAKLKPYILTE